MEFGKIRVVLVSVLICMALSGCGQKGPLYLPDDAQAPDHQKKR